MLYVESRKSLEGKRGKKLLFCRVPIKNTRQQHHFAECQKKTLDKNISLPSVNKNTRQTLSLSRQGGAPNGRHMAAARPAHVPILCRVSVFAECFRVVCRVFFIRHSVKLGFAKCYMFTECFIQNTR